MNLPGKGIRWKEFLWELKDEYQKDKVNDVAAGLTYYGVLALFPFILFLVALAGLVVDPAHIRVLLESARGVIPEQALTLVEGWLDGLVASSGGGLLTIGIAGALWAASGGVAAVIRALNTAYDVDEGRPFWKVRLISLGVAIVAAVLSIVAALLAVAIPPLARSLGEPLGSVLNWLRLPVAALFMMFVWAVMYWILPDVEQRKFKFITPGSVIGVVVWTLASWGFSVYVRNFGHYEATYGALGGIIVMLLWMWITAQVLIVGGVINAIIEHHSPEGKRPGAKSADDTGTTPTGKAARSGNGSKKAPSKKVRVPIPSHPRPDGDGRYPG